MSLPPSPPGSCPSPENVQEVVNPPGLAAISYRVSDFAGFRRALLRPLPGEQAIGTWRPVAGDLGLQVLEWWSYLADVLTFYNERHANESYLRTATRRSSIANLVALLGYEPAPGVAASGQVAVVRRPRPPAEPLVIPAGMQLSSVPSAAVPSQTFEVDATATFTGPSTLPAGLAPDTTLKPADDGTVPVLLAGRLTGVKPGDELLLVAKDFDGTFDSWSAVTVSAVAAATDTATGAINTLLVLGPPASGWQSEWWLSWLLEQRSDGRDYRLMRPAAAATLWHPPSALQPTSAVTGTGSANQGAFGATVNLSAVVRGIAVGEPILFATSNGAALALVTAVTDTVGMVGNPNNPPPGQVPTQPNIVIPFSELTVDLWWLSAWELGVLGAGVSQPGSVVVRYGFKDVGTIIGFAPASLDVLPATVSVPALDAPPVGATALLEAADGSGVPVTVTGVSTQTPGSADVTLAGAGTPPAAITTPLAVPLTLLLDVVEVSRGKTVSNEVLGSGNAALANQAFTLSKAPLTYLSGPAGPTSTLAVYVDGVQWQEVESFYGQPADARVFAVSRSADQAVTTITFGDGLNGARLPSGSGNVVASYRYGAGAPTPPAGRLTNIVKPQPNLAAIRNPVAVSGGADPQDPADVRADAPASVTTFGRAISARDYELIAAQAPGVDRASAYWTFDATQQRTLVTVYVGDDEAAVVAASAALAGAEDPNRPVLVRGATPLQISISCTLLVAADRDVQAVLAAATASISDPATGLFSPRGMAIGQRLYRSAVDAGLMVAGVVAVHSLYVLSSEEEVFDPGEGRFWVLADDALEIAGVSAGA